MPSPYFIGVDPSPAKLRMFFGRRPEIRAIGDHLRNGDSVLLIGERRIGKTFLLYMIGDFASKGADFCQHLLDRQTAVLLAELRNSTPAYHWAFVDLLGVTNAAGFYFNVLARLADERVEQFLSLSPIDHTTFANELTRLSKDLSCRGQRAVVLVDESEKLLDLDESADVFACLKIVIQQCDSVDFVLAGDIKPHEETPEFVNLKGALRPIHLAPLHPADAKALIQVPVRERLSFEDSVLQRILELTGAKPSLVQILCGHLYELVAGNVEDTSEVRITLADFDRLWESELRDKVFESFDAALMDFFEGLQGHEQSIFAFLAHNPQATVDGIAKALGIHRALAQRGLYRLRTAHRVEEAEPGFRITAKIVEDFGSRFVAGPLAQPSQSTPLTVTRDDQPGSDLSTNLKHHAEEIAALVRQWKGVRTQEEIESWLLMFEDHERDVAVRLLSNARYYAQDAIDERLRILHGKFMRTIDQRVKRVWFFGMGEASKSGHMLLYRYRAVNGLSASHFKDLRVLPAFVAKNIRILAFVDDFIGTGQQVTRFWNEELKGQHGIEKAELYCLVLFAFQRAIEHIHAETPLRVICVEQLDKRDRVFSSECTIFGNEEERVRAEEICRRHGEVLCPQHPLGYDDSQALIAFDYQTPNNSLPILWSSAKTWIPIFSRKA